MKTTRRGLLKVTAAGAGAAVAAGVLGRERAAPARSVRTMAQAPSEEGQVSE